MAKKPEEQTFDQAFDELTAETPAGEAETEATPAATAAPPAAAPAATAAEPAAGAAPAAETDADVFAGLNDKQRQKLAELQTQLSTVSQQARSDAGRVAALNDALAKARKQPGGDRIVQALQSPEGWQKLEADYPDIAKPLSAAFDAQAKAIRDEVTEVIKPLILANQENAEGRQREFLANQFSALDKAHPDWRQTVGTKEFNDWLAKQAPLIQNGMDSQHAADAIHVINEFNRSKSAAVAETTVADITQQRQQRLQQAATVHGKQQAALMGRGEIPDDFDAAWAEYDRRDAAVR